MSNPLTAHMPPDHSPQRLEVTQGRTLYYRQTPCAPRPGGYHYRLEAIAPFRTHVEYTLRDIWTMEAHELSQLKLLDAMLVREANTAGLRFVFLTQSDGAYVCHVTPTCHLSPVEHHPVLPPPAAAKRGVAPDDADVDEYISLPVYTTLHDFQQLRAFGNRCLYQRTTLAPSNRLFVPVWLSSEGLVDVLNKLRRQALPRAELHATMVINGVDSQSAWVRSRQYPTADATPIAATEHTIRREQAMHFAGLLANPGVAYGQTKSLVHLRQQEAPAP